MAHSLSAKKRVRQNASQRAVNRWRLRAMRDALKEFNDAIVHGTADKAQETFSKCVAVIDRSAGKGVIHSNQAARRKSRLNDRLRAKKLAKA